MFSDEQVRELNMIRKVDHKRLGELDVVRQPLNFSDFEQPDQLEHPAPDLGQHTKEILLELGLEEEAIKDLIKKEVI